MTEKQHRNLHSLQETGQIFKAVGDETRLKMIGLLQQGELCVCDLMEVLEIPQSTASRHLAYLKNAGWIVGRRSGKWMYYTMHPLCSHSTLLQCIIQNIADMDEMKKLNEELFAYLATKEGIGRCAS